MGHPVRRYPEAMATQALPRKRATARKKKKSGIRWHTWWPLLLGIIATPFAVKTAEILPLMGQAGLHRLCLLMPFALLAQWHTLDLAESIPQTLLYLQFPIYGVLLMLVHRFRSLTAGALTVVCVHLVAAAAAWLLVIRH
jgi:hypothetical protein